MPVISSKNAKRETPWWVVPFVAAATFLFQGVPPLLENSEVIGHHTSAAVSLICDISNVMVASLSIFIGAAKPADNEE